MLEHVLPATARGVLSLTPVVSDEAGELVRRARSVCVLRPYHGVSVNADMAGDLGAVYPSRDTRPDLTSVFVTAVLLAAGKNTVFVDRNAERRADSPPPADLYLVKCCLPTIKNDLVLCTRLESLGAGRAVPFGAVLSHVAERERPSSIKGYAPVALGSHLGVDWRQGIQGAFSRLAEFNYGDVHGDRLLHIMASIGCNRGCLYCPYIRSLGRWQPLPSAAVEAQVVGALRAGATRLQFRDQDFPSDPRWALEVAGLVGRTTDRATPWAVEGNLDRFSDGVLDACAENGADEIIFGIESADDELLKTAHRRPNAGVVERVEAIRSRGLSAHGLFVIGLPGDSYGSVRRTVELALRLGLSSAQFNQYAPLPDESFGNGRVARLHDYVQHTNSYKYRTCERLDPVQVRQSVRLAQAAFNAARLGGEHAAAPHLERLSELAGHP